jgi:uncharacterized iron-regulated membrane protein
MSFLDRPQSLWWRKLLFQLHLWVGVGVGLYVFLMGVTGAALVFRDEIEHALHRNLIQYGDASARPDLVSFADMLRQAYPDLQLASISMPSEDHPNVVAYLVKDERYLVVFVDPADGKIIGELDSEGSFLHWLQRLHFDLLAGRTGRIVNGVGALFLLLLCLTGIVIWWPGVKHWKRSLTVDFRKKWKRFTWDLHSATGFWTLPVIAMWAVTGAYFAWPAEFRAIVDWFSPVSLAKLTPPDPAQQNRFPPPDIRALLRQAHEKSPGASLLSISFPLNEHGHIRVFLARQHPPSYETADYHYFDPFTGQHVTVWRRGLNQSLGDAVISWLGPLHFGTFGGPGAAGVIVKILWVLLGLAPPTLMVTGFLMYWNRYLSKKWVHLKHQRERQIQQGMPAGMS